MAEGEMMLLLQLRIDGFVSFVMVVKVGRGEG